MNEIALLIIEQTAFFGAAISFLLALSIVFVRARLIKNWFLFLTLISVGIVEGAIYFVLSPLVKIFPSVWLIHLPALFILGPTTYLYYHAAMTDNFKMQLRYWLFFLPAIAAAIFIAAWGFYEPNYKVADVFSFFDGAPATVPDFLLVAGFLFNISFYLTLLFENRFFWRIEVFKQEFSARFFIFLILGSLVIGLVAVTAVIVREMNLIYVAAVAIAMMLAVSYVINQRYPEFFQALQIAAEKSRYQRSHLNDVNLENLQAELKTTMEHEKIFCQEELSLPALAEELNLSPHQLSQYLNEKLKKNFSQFINEYRIEEAKSMLQSDLDESILTIAYKVGFNSKSTFNAVFLKITGQTPSGYRKK